MKKLILLFLPIFFIFSLINFSFSETLELPAGIWEGDVKKGKAHGVGVLTFKDGSLYEGKISKNKIHGTGKYITKDGEEYEGKWRYGKYINKIDKKTRKIIKLNTKEDYFSAGYEIKGKGSASRKWFEAEEKSGSYVLTASGERKMEDAIRKGSASESSGGGGGGGGSGC